MDFFAPGWYVLFPNGRGPFVGGVSAFTLLAAHPCAATDCPLPPSSGQWNFESASSSSPQDLQVHIYPHQTQSTEQQPVGSQARPMCQSLYMMLILYLHADGPVTTASSACLPEMQAAITMFESTCSATPIWVHTNGKSELWRSGQAVLEALDAHGAPRTDATPAGTAGLRGCKWRQLDALLDRQLVIDGLAQVCGGDLQQSIPSSNLLGDASQLDGLYEAGFGSSWSRVRATPGLLSAESWPELLFEADPVDSDGGYWVLSNSGGCDLWVVGATATAYDGCYSKSTELTAWELPTWRTADGQFMLYSLAKENEMAWVIYLAQPTGYTGDKAVALVFLDKSCTVSCFDSPPSSDLSWKEYDSSSDGFVTSYLTVGQPQELARSPFTAAGLPPKSGLWSVSCHGAPELVVSGSCDADMDGRYELQTQPVHGRPYWRSSDVDWTSLNVGQIVWMDFGSGPMWTLSKGNQTLDCASLDAGADAGGYIALSLSASNGGSGDMPAPSTAFSWIELGCPDSSAPAISSSLSMGATGAGIIERDARTLVPVGIFGADALDVLPGDVPSCSTLELLQGTIAASNACCGDAPDSVMLGCTADASSLGVPHQCSPACAAVYPAFWRSCGSSFPDSVTGDQVEQLQVLARQCETVLQTSRPKPAAPCTDYVEFAQHLDAITSECCDQISEDCSSGLPAVCNVGCAGVLLPAIAACTSFLGEHSSEADGIDGASVLAQLIQAGHLCGISGH